MRGDLQVLDFPNIGSFFEIVLLVLFFLFFLFPFHVPFFLDFVLSYLFLTFLSFFPPFLLSFQLSFSFILFLWNLGILLEVELFLDSQQVLSGRSFLRCPVGRSWLLGAGIILNVL